MKDYKTILEGVVNIINTTEKSDIGFANICAYIGKKCPELKESEDERIRKGLLYIIEHHPTLPTEEAEEYIAWLEKQGEKKAKYHDICDKCVRQPICQSDCFLQQGEQKPDDKVEPKFNVGDLTAYFTECMSLKHTEEDIAKLLKSLKDRVQPKPAEWTEEDKRKMDRIYSLLLEAADTHAFSTSCRLIGDKECIELQDFLKSLKDRVQPHNMWKPSDEQMLAINTAINVIGKGTINGKYLIELHEQLKKLREE